MSAPLHRRSVWRGINGLVFAVLLAAVALLAVEGWRIVDRLGANHTIAALSEGRDVPVADNAPARLLLARAYFLLTHAQMEAAEPLVQRLGKGEADRFAVAAFYDMANARLASAIDHLERSEIDPAIPEVRLAKGAYRAALARNPQAWDAKYNLDIAMRLIRDFPQIEAEPEDEPAEAPKRVWTDLPGLPKGLP